MSISIQEQYGINTPEQIAAKMAPGLESDAAQHAYDDLMVRLEIGGYRPAEAKVAPSVGELALAG